MAPQIYYVLTVIAEEGVVEGVSQQSTFSEYLLFKWKKSILLEKYLLGAYSLSIENVPL